MRFEPTKLRPAEVMREGETVIFDNPGSVVPLRFRVLRHDEVACKCFGCRGVAVVILGPLSGGFVDGTELCDACVFHYAEIERFSRRALPCVAS